MAKKVQITETVLRDANQSLMATRLPYSDFEDILETMDKAGYYSVECWGGATFDSCLRYLGEAVRAVGDPALGIPEEGAPARSFPVAQNARVRRAQPLVVERHEVKTWQKAEVAVGKELVGGVGGGVAAADEYLKRRIRRPRLVNRLAEHGEYFAVAEVVRAPSRYGYAVPRLVPKLHGIDGTPGPSEFHDDPAGHVLEFAIP